jgi:hypothetical protein
MNCEEYRKAIASDPSFDGGAAHLSECQDCQRYRRQMLELEKAISAALSLDVPDLKLPELPDIDAGNVASLPRRRWNPPTLLAMAATVVLAAFLGVRMFGIPGEPETLADQLLAHIDHEPNALRVTSEAVSDARLASVIPAEVAHMDHSAGLITYARSCPINGHEVPHLVIQGQRGPVTLLLMPNEKIDGPQSVTGEGVTGVILPVGDGSIAIFGERDESLEPIQKKVLDSVTWST